MNNEDQFEQRLQRQPLRPLPEAWRNEILGTAHQAASHGDTAGARTALPALNRDHHGNSGTGLSALHSLFVNLFWPHPKAWVGLAAVWALILGLNLANRESEPSEVAAQAAPPSPQLRQLLQQQEQLFAELVREAPEATEPRRPGTQPRSQRRPEVFNA